MKEKIVINDDNLKMNEVNKQNSKVRAILVNDNNEVMVAYYGGVILLPGGSMDKDENVLEALRREIREEIGISYETEDLSFLAELDHFQRNYVSREGATSNLLVKTYYFTGSYKSIDYSNQHLTRKEKKDGFRLELIPLEEIEKKVLENQNDNPRNEYFQRELLEIINVYKSIGCNKKLNTK